MTDTLSDRQHGTLTPKGVSYWYYEQDVREKLEELRKILLIDIKFSKNGTYEKSIGVAFKNLLKEIDNLFGDKLK